MSATCSTMMATTVITTIEIRIAPLTPRAYSENISTSPRQNTATGQPWSCPPMPELDRHRAGAGTAHEAGVDQADDREEQADTDRDRDLELLPGPP